MPRYQAAIAGRLPGCTDEIPAGAVIEYNDWPPTHAGAIRLVPVDPEAELIISRRDEMIAGKLVMPTIPDDTVLDPELWNNWRSHSPLYEATDDFEFSSVRYAKGDVFSFEAWLDAPMLSRVKPLNQTAREIINFRKEHAASRHSTRIPQIPFRNGKLADLRRQF
jgi:hypothetical protein